MNSVLALSQTAWQTTVTGLLCLYTGTVPTMPSPKLIQFNARNVNKIRIVQTPRVLQWSRTAILQQDSASHHGTEKTDCSIEESERELVVPRKPRNRERNG